MTFFHLHTHCHLVKGKVHSAIFDIFQERVFWLREEPYSTLIDALDKGCSLEQFCNDHGLGPDRMRGFLDFLRELDYGGYSERPVFSEKFRPGTLPGQEEKFTLHRPLSRLVMEISSRCPLNCSVCGLNKGLTTAHCACGVWSPENETGAQDGFLESCLDLLNETKKHGINGVLIQGGDPFMEREILYPLGERAKQLDISLSVHSAGYSITEDDLAFIEDNGVTLIVPVFGASKETYEAVTNTPGSFKALTDILQAQKAGRRLNVVAIVVLTNENINEHESIVPWLQEHSVQSIFVEYYLRFDPEDGENSAAHPGFQGLFKNSPENYTVSSETFLRLASGQLCWQDQLAITRDRQVIPCIAARTMKIGSLKEQTLPEILKSQARRTFRDAGTDKLASCQDCELRYGCSSCMLTTEALTRSFHKRSWNCTYDPLTGEWGSPAF